MRERNPNPFAQTEDGPSGPHMSTDVYEALQPMDGYPKGTRGGPRPYRYDDPDGHAWWVIVSLSDFGDEYVGMYGPIAPVASPSPGNNRNPFDFLGDSWEVPEQKDDR
jgi:hypothetical protein